jgi:hypothetical protein
MGVRRLVFTIVGIALLATLITPATVLADDLDSAHYRVRTVTLADGTSIDEVIINGPPTPPLGYERATAEVPEPNLEAGLTVLSDVPAFDWSFGCSATSAAMMAGYYDRTGYVNMYAGPTNGGVMPMDNSIWPDWHDGVNLRDQCPLSATHNGLDGRGIKGHVDDYWVSYGSSAPDPFIDNWPEHAYGDCTGDYMKTNQYNYGNSDGSTKFFYYTSGAETHDYDLETAGPGYYDHDGGYGLKLFYESRGYTVTSMYNQYLLGVDPDEAGPLPVTTDGCVFDDYKAEIDAGRPVLIHVRGHTMLGYGYDDPDTIYIHDTWDYNSHTMPWGGSYSGMQHLGVTVFQLESLPVITSCDSGGTEVNSFAPGENVSVKGSGLEPDTQYKIWLQDNPVNEGDPLNSSEDDSGSQETVTTDGSGNFGPTPIWAILGNASITNREYDIVVNKGTGEVGQTYNAADDGLDSATAVGITAPVPELPTILLFSMGLLVLTGYVVVRKKDE